MESTPFHDGFPFGKRKPEPAAVPEKSPRPAPALVPDRVPTPTPQVPQRERRRAARQTLVAKATIRPDASVTMPALVTTGFVSNISMGGIGFHTRRPLAVGEKYSLNLEIGPVKWASRFRVVSCQAHGGTGTFDVGAEFVGNDLMSRTKQMAA
jgi:hypothetical protein